MSKKTQDVEAVITEWLNKGNPPIPLSDQIIKKIAELCIKQSLDNSRDKFRKNMQDIIDHEIKIYMLGGGK